VLGARAGLSGRGITFGALLLRRLRRRLRLLPPPLLQLNFLQPV
jgi:hypothetical protein